MRNQTSILTSLEGLLVKQFRTYQRLVELTQEERQVLFNNESENLMPVVERKEAVLDELGRLDDQLGMLTDEWGNATGLRKETIRIADILPTTDPQIANRLRSLREGILALAKEVRSLNSGNIALAQSRMEQADSLQAFLLSLFQLPPSYHPLAEPVRTEAAVWELDQRV